MWPVPPFSQLHGFAGFAAPAPAAAAAAALPVRRVLVRRLRSLVHQRNCLLPRLVVPAGHAVPGSVPLVALGVLPSLLTGGAFCPRIRIVGLCRGFGRDVVQPALEICPHGGNRVFTQARKSDVREKESFNVGLQG